MIRIHIPKYSLIVISLLLAILIIGIASADVPWVNSTGGDHEGADWTPDDGTTIAGDHYNIGTFTVQNGYTINVVSGTELEIDAYFINVIGTINGNADGYAAGCNEGNGQGPGGGGGGDYSSGSGSGAGGAGYGGAGGSAIAGYTGSPGSGGSAYGSSTDVSIISMGSGGGGAAASGGCGGRGGASIMLSAIGINVSGTITCNGGNGVSYHFGGGGGGAGGGILINGSVVAIPGTLSVDGGNGGNGEAVSGGSGGGGAGGGRIKVAYLQLNDAGLSYSIAEGSGGSGYGGSSNDGAVGTYYTMYDPDNLTIYNRQGYINESDDITPIENANVTISNTTWSQTVYSNSIGYWNATELTVAGSYNYSVSKSNRVSETGAIYFSTTSTNNTNFALEFPAPSLLLPTNSSTEYVTFPPLVTDITFSWENTNVVQYRLMVAEDIGFNVMSVDLYTSTTTSTQTLMVNKEYFWKIYAYDGIDYSDSSDVYSFNLTGNSSLTGSAIEGVVYQSNGELSAISGAEVTIWNATWSSSMITGSNGYYVFKDLESDTVYNLQAKSDRYWDSSIALVSAEDNPVTNNFYLIDDLTDTEWWHYVEFTVQNVWGVTHPDVATKVYIGDSPTVSDSGNTESDGTITFHMDQNVQYRITFINATLGINEDITLYPVSSAYTVYIDSYSFDLPDAVTDDISAYIASSRINATIGYINFTYSDTSDLTTSINYYIFDVEGNELYNTSTSNSDLFDSQVVTATDDRYVVRYVGVHPTHGIIDKTETIVFHGGRRVDFGWDSDWQYAVTALAFLIFIGSMFGAKTAHYGAITVVMFAFIFKWIGWLDETNTSTLLIILAAVIAFGWSLRKSEEVKM